MGGRLVQCNPPGIAPGCSNSCVRMRRVAIAVPGVCHVMLLAQLRAQLLKQLYTWPSLCCQERRAGLAGWLNEVPPPCRTTHSPSPNPNHSISRCSWAGSTMMITDYTSSTMLNTVPHLPMPGGPRRARFFPAARRTALSSSSSRSSSLGPAPRRASSPPG